jgi:PKD repeat protein
MLNVTLDSDQLSAAFDTTTGAPLSDTFTIDRAGGTTNQPPSAVFSSACSGLSCTFDGSGSSDPDGSIMSYAWDFGDSHSATGAKPAPHPFAAAGTYTVTLTVTDNAGATNSVSHPVTVSSGGGGGAVSFVGAAHGQPGSVKTEQLTIPAATTTGDTMLLLLTRATSAAWSGPSGVTGWTQLGTFTNGTTTSTLWQKSAAAGDPGTTLRFTKNTYGKAAVQLGVYRGANPGATITSHAGDSNRSAHNTAAINAAAGALVVSLWSDKSETTTNWTAPASVTRRDTNLGTGSGRYSDLLTDSGTAVTAGTYGPLTATTNANSTYGDTWTIALTPAN